MFMSARRLQAYTKSCPLMLSASAVEVMKKLGGPACRVWTLMWNAPLDEYAYPILVSECRGFAFEGADSYSHCESFVRGIDGAAEPLDVIRTTGLIRMVNPGGGAEAQIYHWIYHVLRDDCAPHAAIRQPGDPLPKVEEDELTLDLREDRFQVTYWIFDDDDLQ